MAIFVRVVHRKGWQVETFKGAGVVESTIRRSREEALKYATSLNPEWIEVGDIVGLDTADQHHAWSALRRQADGSYGPSPLKWQRRQPAKYIRFEFGRVFQHINKEKGTVKPSTRASDETLR